MNRKRFIYLLESYAAPILLSVAGLVMVLCPDSASALVSDVLAWGLIIVGVCLVLGIVIAQNYTSVFHWLQAAGCLGLGVFFLANPLLLAQLIGQVLGLLVLVQGINSIRHTVTDFGKVLSIITIIVGIILVVAPMSLSRLVLRILGVVMVVVGAGEMVDRFYLCKRHQSDDTGIIDAE